MRARAPAFEEHGDQVAGSDRNKQFRRLHIISSAVLATADPDDGRVSAVADDGEGTWEFASHSRGARANFLSSCSAEAVSDAAASDEAGPESFGSNSSASSSSCGKCDLFRAAAEQIRTAQQRLAAVCTALRSRGMINLSRRIRTAAAKALVACETCGALAAASVIGAEDAVAGLILTVLIDRQVLVREAAAEALGQYGGNNTIDVDVGELSQALIHVASEDDTWTVRAAALRSLGRLARSEQIEGRHFATSIAAAAAARLSDEAWQVRWHAAEVLEAAGEAAADYSEVLLGALGDPMWQVRRGAAAALAASTESRATDGLMVALRSDDDPCVRESIARALGSSQCKDSRSRAATALADALTVDPSWPVRVAAVRGLSALGSAAVPHAKTLALQLQASDATLRLAVREFFCEATSPQAAAFAATFKLEVCQDNMLQAEAAQRAREALLDLSPLAAAVAPHAERFADDLLSPFTQARLEAEQGIEALGASAVPCMVERVAKARDGDFRKRMAAMRGLSCTGVLSHDSACAFLAEWIYQPSVETLPVSGLELTVLQTPEEHLGMNLQWAVLVGTNGTFRGQCFLVFRGSETAIDWTENSYTALKGIEVPRWGMLLLHSGFWSAVEGERDRLSAALEKAAAGTCIQVLVVCGGSKGGANALATAALLLTPRLGQLEALYQELLVVTFGAPNIAGRGSDAQGSTSALNHLRAALRQRAPRSRSWVFTEDPVPALMSSSSGDVLDEYGQGARWAIKLLRYLKPDAYKKAKGYFQQAVKVTRTLEPLLPEEPLVPPPAVRAKKKSRFDASVHPQLNYTEALCRRMLGQEVDAD